MTIPAPPPRRWRWGRSFLACALAVAGAGRPGAALAAPSCATAKAGWCVARRFPGSIQGGELGFRFGEPLDADGDGQADVAAGARFKRWQETQYNGDATVWSGATGGVIRTWDGEFQAGLFGHWTMLVPDLSGDGLADVVIAAPQALYDGRARGVLVAYSPKTGHELWRRWEIAGENLGWDLTLAGDHDGDGRADLFVGAPSDVGGRVRLVSGAEGAVLRTYEAPEEGGSFGWYVARLDDADGDARADMIVGGPSAVDTAGARVGGAWIVSSASGKVLHHWKGTDPRGGFGGVVEQIADADGDGKRDVAVSAPATEDQARTLPGEVFIYSSATGKELRRWTGGQPGELFGRMVTSTRDLDGDGVDDVAIGAPWWRRGRADRVGRVELRSGRTGKVLAKLEGDEGEDWFGWHIRRAPDPEGHGRPALLIDSLRHPVDGKFNVGVLDLYLLRPATKRAR